MSGAILCAVGGGVRVGGGGVRAGGVSGDITVVKCCLMFCIYEEQEGGRSGELGWGEGGGWCLRFCFFYHICFSHLPLIFFCSVHEQPMTEQRLNSTL